MSYSQFGEDDLVIEHFSKQPPTKRRFLDIGAHDGISCSNSKRLVELGWGGTCVEPSPLAFAKLLQVHVANPEVALANVGMVPKDPRILQFYESGGLFVGTFDDKHRDEWEGKQHVHYRPIYVVGCTFDLLFDALPGPYRFISIDVEGTNVELFESLLDYGLARAGAEMVCVEHQGQTERVEAMAIAQGFVTHKVTEANILLVRS